MKIKTMVEYYRYISGGKRLGELIRKVTTERDADKGAGL
jgi:hypothetical protein